MIRVSERKITPEDFQERMRRCKQMGDKRVAYIEAIELMCKALAEQGYGEGVVIFDTIEKPYK